MRHRTIPLACGLLAAALLLGACGDEPPRARKAQVVKLLPDTPPPPPPPPKPEDKPPPPKPDDKPPPMEAPKPVEAPTPQALKSDEAAGDGPGNGLTAGAVTRDYTDQKIGQATVIGGAPAEPATARLAAQAYAGAATRVLHDFLARDREVKRRDYQVRVDLWLTPSGALQRAELVGSSGDADTDRALRAALERFPGAGAPPPARMPLPMRLLITNRMMG
jgi:protein TonB